MIKYSEYAYQKFKEQIDDGTVIVLSVELKALEWTHREYAIKSTDGILIEHENSKTIDYEVMVDYVLKQSLTEGKAEYLTETIWVIDKELGKTCYQELADCIKVTKR